MVRAGGPHGGNLRSGRGELESTPGRSAVPRGGAALEVGGALGLGDWSPEATEWNQTARPHAKVSEEGVRDKNLVRSCLSGTKAIRMGEDSAQALNKTGCGCARARTGLGSYTRHVVLVLVLVLGERG